ncbi:MAG: hypothetical protein OXF56_14325 [Rhodobacteraceae bacterium]|nr:hypothetical protein [Paracoccaceae bacterium]
MPTPIAFRFRSPGFSGFCHNQVSDAECVRGATDLATTASLTVLAGDRPIKTVQNVFAQLSVAFSATH